MDKVDFKGKKVLIIGAGRAGLHAAQVVSSQGGEAYLLDDSCALNEQVHMAQGELSVKSEAKEKTITFPAAKVLNFSALEITSFSFTDDSLNLAFKKRIPFVDLEKCDSCKTCEKVCPIHCVDEDDSPLSLRTAISRQNGKEAGYSLVKEDPPCQKACPIHLDVRGYVGLIADGKFGESLALIREKLPFPAVCGRICPRFCEAKCNRLHMDQSLNIRSLKRFVSDWECERTPAKRHEVKASRESKVAIIGGGPAGLTCAYDLRLLAYPVTVFESLPVCGGMLAVGIPNFRLPKDILNREIAQIRDIGVEIKTNVTLGKDLAIDDLFKQNYKAIFIAIGAHKGMSLGIPGEDSNGVLQGIKVLKDINLGKSIDLAGKRVCVVGGGNVAIDVARSLVRIEAQKVTIAYRRTQKEMPADEEEIEAALAEGIEIEFLTVPVEIIAQGKKVTGLKCLRAQLGKKDQSGKRRPVPVEGSEFTLPTDAVINAVGQRPDYTPLEHTGINVTPMGTISVDPETFTTNVEGVFAGGDVVTGHVTAIEAIATGKNAAVAIHHFLSHRKGAP